MKICLLLQSTRVTAPDFATMVAACQLQLARDVSTAWERLAPELAIVTSAAEVPAGAALVVLLDTPDQANALGYHEELNDQPDGKVFAGPVLDNAGVVLRDTTNPQNTSVASVLSHELCELYIDVDANQYADGPAIKEGSSYAYEVCDPVQGVSYDVTTASGELVAVSDFVLPAWFDPEAPAGTRLDQAGQCKAPFTVVSGGYMIVRTAPGNESQVMGEEVPRWRGLSSRATRRYRGSGPIFCRVSPHRHTPILHGPMDHLGNFVGEFPNPHMPLSQDWNNHEALMKQRALTLEMARRDPFFEDSRLLNDVDGVIQYLYRIYDAVRNAGIPKDLIPAATKVQAASQAFRDVLDNLIRSTHEGLIFESYEEIKPLSAAVQGLRVARVAKLAGSSARKDARAALVHAVRELSESIVQFTASGNA